MLFPAFQFVLNLGELTAMEARFLDALALLLAIVVQQAEGIFAQQDDGYEVAGGEESHEEVDDVPHQLEAGHSTEHHHHTCLEDAVDGHHFLAGRDEADVCLAVIVVANDA